MVAIKKPYPSNFKKTQVYSKAVHYVKDIYDTIEQFPAIEKYAMADQLRRAVCSISSNIAEGRQSMYYQKDYRHLDIALASVAEVISFLDIALLLNYITETQFKSLHNKADEIIKMLIGLMRYIDRQIKEGKQESVV